MGAKTSPEMLAALPDAEREKIISRFEASFVKIGEDECWEWQKSLNSGGYGVFSVKSKTIPAHRFSYELYNGEPPGELFVCHRCDNRKCINPKHFFLGDYHANMNDMMSKGRIPDRLISPYNAKLTIDQVIEIRNDQRKYADIGAEFGITPANVSHIKTKKIWFWVPESMDHINPDPPSPSEIRLLRESRNLTQTSAAELIHSRLRTWQDWEAGKNTMHPAMFGYFKVKISMLE